MPVRKRPYAPVFDGGMALRLVGVGLMALLFGALVGYAADSMGGAGNLLGAGAAQVFVIVALVFSRQLLLPELEYKNGCFCWGVAAGLFAAFVAGGLVRFVEALGIYMEPQAAVEQLRMAGGLQLALMGVLSTFTGPIAEEVYFRGWWLAYAGRTLGPLWAIVVTSLLFALAHGSLFAFGGLFVLGLVLGLAALRWGVVSAIVGHAVFNAVTIFAVKGGWI